VPLGKTLNAIPHLGAKLFIPSIPVVVAQLDERHANRTASVLKWYMADIEHTTSGSNEEDLVIRGSSE